MAARVAGGLGRDAVMWLYKTLSGGAPAGGAIAHGLRPGPSLETLRASIAMHPVFQTLLSRLAPQPEAAVARAPSRLAYVIDRIEAAPILRQPFPHLYIENLFTDGDFAELVRQPEIKVPPMASDEALIEALHRLNFKEITFPGTTTDLAAYLAWRADPSATNPRNEETCEGCGVVMRLQAFPRDTILEEIGALFASTRFWTAAAARFGVPGAYLRRDYGLQKYLDGYEISPHPDIRSKALTFMINVNPDPKSEDLPFHTHYMTLRPERDYVSRIWADDPTAERRWLPWDWCETRSIQTRNNSMVIFAPGADTLHAIKASYDHLQTQRTQLYGNLWYRARHPKWAPDYKALARMAPA
jgi:hypothetical protein